MISLTQKDRDELDGFPVDEIQSLSARQPRLTCFFTPENLPDDCDSIMIRFEYVTKNRATLWKALVDSSKLSDADITRTKQLFPEYFE